MRGNDTGGDGSGSVTKLKRFQDTFASRRYQREMKLLVYPVRNCRNGRQLRFAPDAKYHSKIVAHLRVAVFVEWRDLSSSHHCRDVLATSITDKLQLHAK